MWLWLTEISEDKISVYYELCVCTGLSLLAKENIGDFFFMQTWAHLVEA